MELSLSELEGDKYIKKICNCKIEASNSVHFSNYIVLILTDFNRYYQSKPVVENKLMHTVNVLSSFG